MATYNWNSNLSSLHSYTREPKHITMKTVRSRYHYRKAVAWEQVTVLIIFIINHFYKWSLKVCKWKPSSGDLSAPLGWLGDVHSKLYEIKQWNATLNTVTSIIMVILSGKSFKLITDIMQAHSEHLQKPLGFFLFSLHFTLQKVTQQLPKYSG